MGSPFCNTSKERNKSKLNTQESTVSVKNIRGLSAISALLIHTNCNPFQFCVTVLLNPAPCSGEIQYNVQLWILDQLRLNSSLSSSALAVCRCTFVSFYIRTLARVSLFILAALTISGKNVNVNLQKLF
jgi:hypothetical protein